MASRQDVQKRRAWEVRLERFRASGLTVARFCEQERVSANTFYYWAKRVGSTSARTSSSGSDKASRRGRQSVKHMPTAGGIANAALVRFHWNAAVEVSVPADCLDAIRCLAECLPAGAGGTLRRVSGSRREVVTGKGRRDAPLVASVSLGADEDLPVRQACRHAEELQRAPRHRAVRVPTRHPRGRRVSVSQSPPGPHQADPLGSGRPGDLDEAFGTRHLPETAAFRQTARRSKWTRPIWRCCSRGSN